MYTAILASPIVKTGISIQDLAIFAGLLATLITLIKSGTDALIRYLTTKLPQNGKSCQSDQCRFDHDKIAVTLQSIERSLKLMHKLHRKQFILLTKQIRQERVNRETRGTSGKDAP